MKKRPVREGVVSCGGMRQLNPMSRKVGKSSLQGWKEGGGDSDWCRGGVIEKNIDIRCLGTEAHRGGKAKQSIYVVEDT